METQGGIKWDIPSLASGLRTGRRRVSLWLCHPWPCPAQCQGGINSLFTAQLSAVGWIGLACCLLSKQSLLVICSLRQHGKSNGDFEGHRGGETPVTRLGTGYIQQLQ